MRPGNQAAFESTLSLPAGVSPAEVMSRLETAARRGRLAGLRRARTGQGFRLDLGSHPFDHELAGRFEPDASALHLKVRLLPRMPATYALLIVLSVWPGLWITDSMLTTYFDWYRLGLWWTAAWYIPLTVLPLPWMLVSMLRRSRADAADRAAELFAEIARAVGGDQPAPRGA